MSPSPLPTFPPGSRLKVTGFDGCGAAVSRLLAMGLTPGTPVEVTGNGSGPCRVRARDVDMVLGRGLAAKVLAVRAEEGK